MKSLIILVALALSGCIAESSKLLTELDADGTRRQLIPIWLDSGKTFDTWRTGYGTQGYLSLLSTTGECKSFREGLQRGKDQPWLRGNGVACKKDGRWEFKLPKLV